MTIASRRLAGRAGAVAEAVTAAGKKPDPNARRAGGPCADAERDIFTWDDPRAIALALKGAAEASRRRRTSPFRSAMSMLSFHINRAGEALDPDRRRILERAKEELRAAFGRDPRR